MHTFNYVNIYRENKTFNITHHFERDKTSNLIPKVVRNVKIILLIVREIYDIKTYIFPKMGYLKFSLKNWLPCKFNIEYTN